uniref:Uncharacterized protein n=1 Tax=Chrysotila carterae TaxID=13221 RepID=A0A7S4F8C0_CHRCT
MVASRARTRVLVRRKWACERKRTFSDVLRAQIFSWGEVEWRLQSCYTVCMACAKWWPLWAATTTPCAKEALHAHSSIVQMHDWQVESESESESESGRARG